MVISIWYQCVQDSLVCIKFTLKSMSTQQRTILRLKNATKNYFVLHHIGFLWLGLKHNKCSLLNVPTLSCTEIGIVYW